MMRAGVEKEMLIMETKRKILNRYRRGEKIRSISREMNLSRNTVRSIIRCEGTPRTSYERKVQPYPALGEYVETLEKLLRDNARARPKQTAKQLFESLQDAGYKGSYSSVGRYIAKWNKRASSVSGAACIPLYFAPGEAYQFDWSSEKVKLNGEVVSVKVAHFILCYSRKRFVYVYVNETQEMVFDAHVRAFAFFGGTPLRGIYDNMKTAVQKVLKGRTREWNPGFERLCAHYRIEPTACTPARGNEKGRVERQVKTDRQQFFTPMPSGTNLQELNDILLSRVIRYNQAHKHPEFSDKTVDEAFEEERYCLVSAPLLFEGYKQTDVKASITCLVRYDRNSYSVHCSCAGQIIQVRAYADHLIFTYEGQEVGHHMRRFTRGQTYYDWRHYLPLLERKPGALRNGAPFTDMELPFELNCVRKHLESHPNGARDFAHILSYISLESLESVVSECGIAIKAQAISKDVIVNSLLRQHEVVDLEEDSEFIYPPLHSIPQANPAAYDRLLSEACR
jgi:transposase